MRVLVSGDRNYKDFSMIRSVLDGMHRTWFQNNFPRSMSEEFVVIEGEADGADTLARRAAELMDGVDIEKYPAKWTEHDREGNTPIPCNCPENATRCRPAGPRRNVQMLDEGQPDVVLCFHDNFDASRGTKHMASIAKKAGVPVYLISRL